MQNVFQFFACKPKADEPAFSLVGHIMDRNPAVLRNKAWAMNQRRNRRETDAR